MSSERQVVTARDLVDEAKKRIVILSIWVVGLSYLTSLTSTSVWVNLPAAAFLVILFRYFSLDFEMRRKDVVYHGSSTMRDNPVQEKPIDFPMTTVKKDQWRKKVKSPVVDDAVDQFTRHIVCEWVTDLWYSKLTPDCEGPEELIQIINGVLGEISNRMRNINLIDLLARDVIHLICKHLELFRACQAKIVKNLGSLSFEQRDVEMMVVLAAEKKLHPVLFSAESEHKVLQHIMDALISIAFKPEDVQCSFFRYVARELLACAVMRPVLNLASPRFINERIEQVVMTVRKKKVGDPTADDIPGNNGPSKVSSDDFSPYPDPSVTGVELVELKVKQSKSFMDGHAREKLNRTDSLKDPLLSLDARSTRSWSSLPFGSVVAGDGHIELSASGGEWGDMLDYFSRKKKQALAPEHFENMWSKGRNYNDKDTSAGEAGQRNVSVTRTDAVNFSKVVPKQKENGFKINTAENGVTPAFSFRPQSETMNILADRSTLTPPPLTSDEDEEEHISLGETESGSTTHNSSDDEETRVTGLDSPTTKVWDGRTNRNSAVSGIHHPLEGLDGMSARKTGRVQQQKLHKQRSGRKRSRLGDQKPPLWQEVERTSFLPGDGQDTHPLKQKVKDDNSSDDYDVEILGRLQSGTTTSCSSASLCGSSTSCINSLQTVFLGDSFFKLKCVGCKYCQNYLQNTCCIFHICHGCRK